MSFNKEDIIEAFSKLQASVYYDNTNLLLRKQVADFCIRIQKDKEVFTDIKYVCNGSRENILKNWLNQIDLQYYPKSIDDKSNISRNIITNKAYNGDLKVDRLSVFAYIPIELHIISVVWVMKYGATIDGLLGKWCYGNRLAIENGKLFSGKWLYKKYIRQYQEWWGNGINRANEVLRNDKEDITIISLDITNYYHSINFDFNELFSDVEDIDEDSDIRNSILTNVFIEIHKEYWEKTKDSKLDIFKSNDMHLAPLPIGLLSSPLLANWYLKDFDSYFKKKYKPIYYGRYVDDIMIVAKCIYDDDNSLNIKDKLHANLPKLLNFADENKPIFFNPTKKELLNKKLASLCLQKEKIFIYEFNCELPISILEKFVQEQKNKSSEFRFLSDEEDEGFSSFDKVYLIDTFDDIDGNKSRFKILEDNKFQLSVFLSKLAKRIADKGKDYNDDEVLKVYKYFNGSLILKHYLLWEKILTLFVLSDNKELYKSFLDKVKDKINGIIIHEEVSKDVEVKNILKKTLESHLEESRNMAISLSPSFDNEYSKQYIDSFMVRKHYNIWPLQELMDNYRNKGVFMSYDDLEYPSQMPKWLPYNVSLSDIILARSITNHNFNLNDYLSDFCKINGINDDIKRSIKEKIVKTNNDGYDIIEINSKLINEREEKDKVFVSLIEMSVSENILEEIIENKVDVSKKTELMKSLLDKVSKVEGADIFILPEVALPLRQLREFCLFSSKHQISFTGGIEYMIKDGYVYNQIITCIPIEIAGRRDAIPLIRTKNYYAPGENQIIKERRLKPFIVERPLYHLFHSNNHVFTTYYCYELTNIRDRSLFFSKIDAIYAPVFNKDTYYYNNIIESLVRDMSCYFIQCNVSDYGDSRITRPTKHDRMDLLYVKGGNESNNKIVVLTGVLNIKELRDHQKLSIEGQKRSGKFKTTPPKYDVEMVVRREGNYNFFEPISSIETISENNFFDLDEEPD